MFFRAWTRNSGSTYIFLRKVEYIRGERLINQHVSNALCLVADCKGRMVNESTVQKFICKVYPKSDGPTANIIYNLALRECTALMYAANVPYLAQIFDVSIQDQATLVSMSQTEKSCGKNFVPGVTNISCFYPTSLMEYVKHIHRSPNFFPNLFKLYAEILCGLSNLHSMGIIHRDMKACNIMIDKNSSPVIIDFGYARELPPTNDTLTPTAFTCAYASPESLRLSLGEVVEVGFQTDIWSVGVLFYEILYHYRPFDSPTGKYYHRPEDQFKAISAVFSANPNFLTIFNRPLPSDASKSDLHSLDLCKQLIKDMLSFDARDRKPAMEYLHYPMFVSLRPMLQKSLIRDRRQFKWGIASTEISPENLAKLKCYHHLILLPAFHSSFKCECHGECTQALPLLATGFVTYRCQRNDNIFQTLFALKTYIEPTLRADQTNIDMSRTRTSVVFQYLGHLESLLRPDICYSRISIRFELEKLKQFIFEQHNKQHPHALTFIRSNEILRQKICESFGIPMRYLDELRDNIYSDGLTDLFEEIASHFFELTNLLIRLDGRGFFTSPFHFPSIKNIDTIELGKGCLAKSGSSEVVKIDPYSSFLSSFLVTFELLLFESGNSLSSCIFAVDTKITEETTFAKTPMEVYHCMIRLSTSSMLARLCFAGSLTQSTKKAFMSFFCNQAPKMFKSTEHETIKQCFYLLEKFIRAEDPTTQVFNAIVSKTQLDLITDILARESNPDLIVSCQQLWILRTECTGHKLLSKEYPFTISFN